MESQRSSSTPGNMEIFRQQNRALDKRDAQARVEFLMSDPGLRRLAEEIQEHEFHLGTVMSGMFQAEAERWERALLEGDIELFGQVCHGKHRRHGRICLLDGDHTADGGPHWGRTVAGRPVAWFGSAPDDD